MWKAVEMAASLVKPGGLFYIALYNKRLERKGSEYWLNVKRRYNNAPRIIKRMMEIKHIIRYTQTNQVCENLGLKRVQGVEGSRGRAKVRLLNP